MPQLGLVEARAHHGQPAARSRQRRRRGRQLQRRRAGHRRRRRGGAGGRAAAAAKGRRRPLRQRRRRVLLLLLLLLLLEVELPIKLVRDGVSCSAVGAAVDAGRPCCCCCWGARRRRRGTHIAYQRRSIVRALDGTNKKGAALATTQHRRRCFTPARGDTRALPRRRRSSSSPAAKERRTPGRYSQTAAMKPRLSFGGALQPRAALW